MVAIIPVLNLPDVGDAEHIFRHAVQHEPVQPERPQAERKLALGK
jgi:hypothetical protein